MNSSLSFLLVAGISRVGILGMIIVLSGFAGCSFLGERTEGKSVMSSSDVRKFSDPVVDVKVLEEAFDGDLLAVVLGVESGEELSAGDLEVEIVFFGNGKQLAASQYPLSNLRLLENFEMVGNTMLSSGREERVILQHTVPDGTTDYQLKVSWGEASPDDAPVEILLAAEPHELAMECAESCDVPFEIALSLKNPTSKTIKSFHFVSWFSASGEQPKESSTRNANGAGENEKEGSERDEERVGRFSLTGQALLPGEVLELTVRLKRPLPYGLYEAGYRPRVELVSFEFAAEDR